MWKILVPLQWGEWNTLFTWSGYWASQTALRKNWRIITGHRVTLVDKERKLIKFVYSWYCVNKTVYPSILYQFITSYHVWIMNYISKTEIDLYLNLVTWNLKQTFILTNQIVRFNFFKVTHTGILDQLWFLQEHPILGQPFFVLHPCKTDEFMTPVLKNSQKINRSVNYITSWLSVVGPVVGLNLPLSYARAASEDEWNVHQQGKKESAHWMVCQDKDPVISVTLRVFTGPIKC